MKGAIVAVLPAESQYTIGKAAVRSDSRSRRHSSHSTPAMAQISSAGPSPHHSRFVNQYGIALTSANCAIHSGFEVPLSGSMTQILMSL